MRVALLSANAPAHDAVGNHIAEKVAFFADRGADVRLFVLSGERLHPAVRPFCQILSDAQPSGNAWSFACQADLVIADFSQYHPLLDWLPLLGEHRPRLLVDYHGLTPPSLAAAQHRECLEQGTRHRGFVWFADGVLAYSRFARRELMGPTGLPAERCFDLGYVIDDEMFRPLLPARLLRQALGLPNATVLLFVGRAAPNKRLPILVESLALLHDQTPPVHAVVIGDTTDVYRAEANRCRTRATELGVADRLHFLGQVEADQLRDAYGSADVFVIPSVHEAFSLPVREAMACGLPVVAARAGALPEAVGSAGLTFTPDDPADLARQVRRVLEHSPLSARQASSPLRIAIVGFRYGTDIVGGAETSLRTIAESAQQAGHHVEVFATSALAENDAGLNGCDPASAVNGIPVHRFPMDRRDPVEFAAAQQRLAELTAGVDRETEEEYLANSIRSAPLLDALRQRIDEFDAVIVGPFLHGLTCDVARAFPAKTLVLPCFHNEPAARLPALLDAYRAAGGLLYHSPEEQSLAEIELGVNHPRAECIGTAIDTETMGRAEQGRRLAGAQRYLLYAGRYAPAKNLPLLLSFARQYAEQHPGRFKFVFIGDGDFPILQTSWAVNLGNVSPAVRRDLMAAAAALIQLSQMESLSLVVLESWAQGVPVVVHQDCDVLAAQVGRADGGWAVADYAGFAAALDELWQTPPQGQVRGHRGQEYVRRQYGSRSSFVGGLEKAIRALGQPLRDLMSQRGLLQAPRHHRAIWREQFGQIIETVLHAAARTGRPSLSVQPRSERRRVPAGLSGILVPVRVRNQGTQAVAAEGLSRWVLRVEVRNEAGEGVDLPSHDTPLPSLLAPGQTVPAGIRVGVPEKPGRYDVLFRAEPAMQHNGPAADQDFAALSESTMQMIVEPETSAVEQPLAFMQAVQDAMTRADSLQQLPDGYEDVTQGLLASFKLTIKSKLLNNFKLAYVDVLSRQQSRFNRAVLEALQELAECCGTLTHLQETGHPQQDAKPTGDAGAESESAPGKQPSRREQELLDELAQNRRQIAALERRLGRLEALLLAREMVIT
jgi:O-antigen biosynthesis protein